MTSSTACKRVTATGRVQGVYFRDTCRTVAEEQGVRGWVRNLPDGSVEAHFEGEPEAVDRLVDWARQGPPAARVDEVRTADAAPEGLSGFEVRSTPRAPA
ncbi:acylphosphatase [Streptomyces sp. ODS28]|uniref:acylphosphatase n=1 Tax=Streptomyces sp. ODS28 TaxID=3136688 RepID=UPI0031F1A5C3